MATSASQSRVELMPLDRLLRQRFHGAANVRGVRFQLLYFALRSFDLYDPELDAATIIGEGLEDIDLRRVRSGHEYVQVKHFGNPLDWSRIAGVISSFQEVAAVDASGHFTLVTNASFAGEAASLNNHLKGRLSRALQPPSLHAKTLAKLQRLFAPAAGPSSSARSAENFLARFRMVRITEDEVVARLYAAVIEHWGVTSGNEELFVLALVNELTSRSGNRLEVSRQDLETVRLRVEEHVARGPINPAVRDGCVSQLQFPRGEDRDRDFGPNTLIRSRTDYYDGRAARPDHIAAELDIRRPQTIQRIEEVLDRASVCAVVASSGQGKSTLAYRYAHDAFPEAARVEVKVCQDEEQVGQIVTYLRARSRLGIPLLVIVDNLGYRTRLWYRLAAAMADAPVSFVVTAREEDWFRYRGNTVGFTWDIVRPQLDFDEARQIYDNLRQRGRVSASVPSAQWAFEQVRERRLLIEYVYLVTHGRMLADRLEEQVATLRQTEEDPGKLEALRLVSVAQRYGARIRAEQLADHAGFRGDPQQSLASLIDEYITCTDDGCEGLHPVRSEHLINILHHPLPVSNTFDRLIGFLDGDDLSALVRNGLADPLVEPSPVLSALVRRCQVDNLALVGVVAGACFEAEEQRFFARNRSTFDRVHEAGGDALVMTVAMSTLPVDGYSMLDGLRSLAEGSSEWASAANGVEAFASEIERRSPEDRLEFQFLQAVLPTMDPARLARDLAAMAEVLHRCFDTKIDATSIPTIREVLVASDWKERTLSLPVGAASWLSFAIYRTFPDDHVSWRTRDRKKIIGFYKHGTRTLAVEEVGTDDGKVGVLIRFPADWREEASRSLNDEAVERLHTLHRFFPDYALYESYGIHPVGEDMVAGFDPTHKRLSQENIWQAVDTRKNANWVRLCRDTFAADSYSSWLTHWESARSDACNLVRKLVSIYTALLGGRTNEQIARLWEAVSFEPLLFRLGHAPIPPGGDQDRHRISKRAGAWSGSLTNFLRQFASHDPTDGTNDDSRLMRVNLRDATNALPDLDNAVSAAYELSGVPRRNAQWGDITAELASYRLLADMLDYSFGPWKHLRTLGGALENPVAAVKEWSISSTEQILVAAGQVVQSLRIDGVHLVLPVSTYEEEHNLRSLIVGLEVTDFTRLFQNMAMVLVALAGACPTVDFLYIAPLLSGRRHYQKQVLRASRWRVQELIENPASDGPLLFPVDPSSAMLSLLPGTSTDSLPEFDLLGSVVSDCAKIVCHTSILAEGRTYLDKGEAHEAQLLRGIEAEYAAAISLYRSQLEVHLEELVEFATTDASRAAWLAFIERCRSASASTCADADKGLVEFGPGSDVERLLYEYLNAAYLGLPPNLPTP
jgi:hypothetical protein